MATLPIFEDLGISLLLELLVVLQRQHVLAPLGGIRTFPLVTVFGTVCALLAGKFGGWVVGVGLVGVVATAISGRVTQQDRGDDYTGLTTAVAMPLMYAVGPRFMAVEISSAKNSSTKACFASPSNR